MEASRPIEMNVCQFVCTAPVELERIMRERAKTVSINHRQLTLLLQVFFLFSPSFLLSNSSNNNNNKTTTTATKRVCAPRLELDAFAGKGVNDAFVKLEIAADLR